MEENIFDKLRRGEKVLCPVCKKSYFDVSGENNSTATWFHCSDPNCRGLLTKRE
ncbi:MAG: hypothetical protein LUI06_04530 [Ruminococcus sp.]|nr:hypothetical protein [Ruminococcus sp.]